MTTGFDPAAVSSLAEEVGRFAGGIHRVPSTHLHLWLPALTVPSSWTAAMVDDEAVSRILLRRSDTASLWSACEVLNLYRIAAAVPEAIVMDNVDRTLRDAGATGVSVRMVDLPSRYGIVSAHAAGWLIDHRGRRVQGHFRYYLVNSPGGTALIEHAMVVEEGAAADLVGEVSAMFDHVQRCLLASIDRPYDPRL